MSLADMHNRTVFPIVGIVMALALSGCSALHHGWDGAMADIGLYGRPQSEQRPTPDSTQSAVRQTSDTGELDSWCRQFATSVAQDAASNGYDAPSQKRRYETTYRPCVGLPESASRP